MISATTPATGDSASLIYQGRHVVTRLTIYAIVSAAG